MSAPTQPFQTSAGVDPVPAPTTVMNDGKRSRHQTPQEYFEEDPLNRKIRRAERRQKQVLLSAAGGSLVGGIVFGPVGLIVGAVAGGVIENRASKCREHAKDRRMQEQYGSYYNHPSYPVTQASVYGN